MTQDSGAHNLQRIAVFCELLRPPFSEGIRNTARAFLRVLARRYQVLGLTNLGADLPEEKIERIAAGKMLLSPALWRRLHGFHPDLTLYFPTACATPFSFLRGRLLRLYGGAPVVTAILQTRRYARYAPAIFRLLQPDLLLAASDRLAAPLRSFGCRVAPLGVGVDLERFRPVDRVRRGELRHKWGVAQEAYVVLHVGHIKEGRQVADLAPLQSQPGVQVVLVGSSTFGADAGLAARLQAQGVRVITEQVPDVAELFQLADCYAFPVQAEENAIEIPLSVLEALATDLPVVSTPYAGLPQVLPEGDGLWYAPSGEALRARVLAVRGLPVATRRRALPFAWERVVAEAVETVERELGHKMQ